MNRHKLIADFRRIEVREGVPASRVQQELFEALAIIVLRGNGWSAQSRGEAREVLCARIWTRLAPIMERQPLPVSNLAPCRVAS